MSATNCRVLVVESPNVLDLLEGRGERQALQQVCGLFGHDVASFFVRDIKEFRRTLKFVGAIVHHPDAGDDSLFIHISVHGDEDGIRIGPDTVGWEQLAELVVEMYDDLDWYQGPIILVLSACGANEQELTKLLKERSDSLELGNPPEYVFVFSDDVVNWDDAVVAWTVFYSQIGSLQFGIDARPTKIRKLLRRLAEADFGTLKYYRWDVAREEYMRFDATQ